MEASREVALAARSLGASMAHCDGRLGAFYPPMSGRLLARVAKSGGLDIRNRLTVDGMYMLADLMDAVSMPRVPIIDMDAGRVAA